LLDIVISGVKPTMLKPVTSRVFHSEIFVSYRIAIVSV
jgi:hypothetical protein